MKRQLLDKATRRRQIVDLTKIVFRQAAAVDPDYERKYLQIVRTMQEHSAKAIRYLQTIKVLRADLDPQFLNSVFHGVTTQIVLQAIAEGSEPDLETVANQWINLLRFGVLQPGLARPGSGVAKSKN